MKLLSFEAMLFLKFKSPIHLLDYIQMMKFHYFVKTNENCIF